METLKPGDNVVTKTIRRVWLWGKLWPVLDRHIGLVVAVEPQGILLNDGLYYPVSELEKTFK